MTVIDNALAVLRENNYVSGIVSLFLILYAGVAAPALPVAIASLFQSSVFKVLFFTLVLVLLRGQAVGIALLLSICFVVSLNTLNWYYRIGQAPVKNVTPMTHMSLAPGAREHTLVEPGTGEVNWGTSDGVNWVQIRGHLYGQRDIKNLLPGGHGNVGPEPNEE
jgi:hypothetical protein